MIDKPLNPFFAWRARRYDENYVIRMFKRFFPPPEALFKKVLDRKIGHAEDLPCYIIKLGKHGESDLWRYEMSSLLQDLVSTPWYWNNDKKEEEAKT